MSKKIKYIDEAGYAFARHAVESLRPSPPTAVEDTLPPLWKSLSLGKAIRDGVIGTTIAVTFAYVASPEIREDMNREVPRLITQITEPRNSLWETPPQLDIHDLRRAGPR